MGGLPALLAGAPRRLAAPLTEPLRPSRPTGGCGGSVLPPTIGGGPGGPSHVRVGRDLHADAARLAAHSAERAVLPAVAQVIAPEAVVVAVLLLGLPPAGVADPAAAAAFARMHVWVMPEMEGFASFVGARVGPDQLAVPTVQDVPRGVSPSLRSARLLLPLGVKAPL